MSMESCIVVHMVLVLICDHVYEKQNVLVTKYKVSILYRKLIKLIWFSENIWSLHHLDWISALNVQNIQNSQFS